MLYLFTNLHTKPNYTLFYETISFRTQSLNLKKEKFALNALKHNKRFSPSHMIQIHVFNPRSGC